MDRVTLENSETVMMVHSRKDCKGYWCCVHHPSPHHMRVLPQMWDADTKIMYRVCEHGYAHPDPDDPHAINGDCFKMPNNRRSCDKCCARPFDIESEI